MNILVLGGTRFIGPPTVRTLVAAGHTVAVFHRGTTTTDLPAGVRHITGDRAQLTDHTATFVAFAPDVVLDMLPMTEADAVQVMATFRGIASRVVALSSQDIYRAFARAIRREPGPPDPLPLTETSPLRDTLYPFRGIVETRYEYDKILVERVIMGDPALPGTILRLPAVYGPGDYQHRLLPYLERIDDGRPAILIDSAEAQWRWTHGYVEDVATAIAVAVTQSRAAGCIYNVGEADALTRAQWVRAIGDAAGWRGRIIAVPTDLLPTALRTEVDTRQDIVTDSSRIARELGTTDSVPRAEALRRTIDWERANPPASSARQPLDYAAEDAIISQGIGMDI